MSMAEPGRIELPDRCFTPTTLLSKQAHYRYGNGSMRWWRVKESNLLAQRHRVYSPAIVPAI